MTTQISSAAAESYAKKYYGIIAKATKLAGFEDFNFQLKTNKNENFILKISQTETAADFLDFQTQILNHLAKKHLSFNLPKPIANLKGEDYFTFQDENQVHRLMRMSTWLNGDLIVHKKFHDSNLLENWGKIAAELYEALKTFEHKAAHRRESWDLSQTLDNKEFRKYIIIPKQLEIIDYFWNLYESQVIPLHDKLPKSIIHADLNDYNILINKEAENTKITGIIDFGDAIYSHRINDLAIACAYAMMFKSKPLEAAANLVKAYHQISALTNDELKILYILIANRLVTTISHAAKNRSLQAENEYLFVSEKPAWQVLKKWYKIPQNLAYYTFRNACNLEPCPQNLIFQNIINQEKKQFASLVNFNDKKVVPLDLSVGSLDLGNNSIFENTRKFQKRIDNILWEQEAEIGIGGYNEIRPFYNTDAYISESNNGRQWRTVHLGLDVWTKAKTPIFAVFDGTVFSIQDNAGDDNYGPTIILKHKITQENEKLIFYTLYGHLSPISPNLKVGQRIQKGEEIATIGTFPQNGNWAEHLHFQVILDMLEQKGDFFGVCTPNEKAIWLSICPDITADLFPNIFVSKSVFNEKEILEKRQQHLGKNLSLSYRKPLHIVRAYRQYLYDTKGRRYLDTVNNVPHVGHQHQKVVRAAQRQIELLNTNTRYLHENIVNYAEALLATFPPELSVCYFVNSGSEANELALRMAKAATNQKDIIALEVGYHGNTNETIAVSSYKFDSKGGSGKPKNTHIVPMPNTFRGEYRNEATAGELYANHVQTAIENINKKGKNIAGFICESILSCGGQIVLPPNYLKTAYAMVRKAGGLCIADEVQVGFGRVGEKFWAFELQNVVPDIVTLGKPIGNGHPLAAVITTRKIAAAFDNGMEYFNTFGGNPVSCAIGQAVLEVIKTEDLQQNALEMGNYLKEKLNLLKTKFPIIGNVRGQGLFLGIELIRNPTTLEPADSEATFIINKMKERAILMSVDGPLHNVLKIKPPLCFSQKDADFLLTTFEEVLSF